MIDYFIRLVAVQLFFVSDTEIRIMLPFSSVNLEMDESFQKSTNETLASVKATSKDSFVIVDLDETLFLRNSSQAYLNCAYPRIVGLILLLAVKATKPWRCLPAPFNQNSVFRDWCLIVTVTVVLPWTWFVWRSRAKDLAKTYCNMPLADAVEASEASLVIATRGFSWVVNPLIRHLPITSVEDGEYEVVACRFWLGVLDRAKSKLSMVQAKFGESAVARSTVVTDSAIDQQLLAAANTPCLTVWPEATFIPAMSDISPPLLRRLLRRNKQETPESDEGITP